jgi:hypothetical protein
MRGFEKHGMPTCIKTWYDKYYRQGKLWMYGTHGQRNDAHYFCPKQSGIHSHSLPEKQCYLRNVIDVGKAILFTYSVIYRPFLLKDYDTARRNASRVVNGGRW